MWQLTWMLSFLPDWFWTLLLFVGILGLLAAWVLKFIPFVSTYKLPIKVGSILSIILSVWFLGAAANEEKWQARVKEMEDKVAAAEAQSAAVNKTVEIKVVEKTKVVQGKSQKIIEYIDREVVKDKEIVKYIENCPVPPAIIDVHNQAATMNKAAEGDKK
jgi:glucan phosphoethanolaminetransferase (alkaline phosphatase superfamily)